MVPVVVSIQEGNGWHEHDENCEIVSRSGGYKCMKDCDDCDWIVELQYHTAGYHAVYCVKRAGDVQHVHLWMD